MQKKPIQNHFKTNIWNTQKYFLYNWNFVKLSTHYAPVLLGLLFITYKCFPPNFQPNGYMSQVTAFGQMQNYR